MDACRVCHPRKRDYTFYSPVHKSFSRIDYILIEHQLIQNLKTAEIKAITLSDHAPVKIQLEICGDARTGTNWKLNDSLIQDPDTAKRVEQKLRTYFEINDTKEISKATLWEAHKAYIRGILISIGARKNKKGGKKTSLLYKEIQELEQGTRPRGDT